MGRGGVGPTGWKAYGLHHIEVLDEHIHLGLVGEGPHRLVDAKLDGTHDLVGANLRVNEISETSIKDVFL